jgi:hypothetical protein
MSDIASVFAKDPLLHTDEDIRLIIVKNRESLHLFNAGGKTPKAPAAPKVGAKKPILDLDLGDL